MSLPIRYHGRVMERFIDDLGYLLEGTAISENKTFGEHLYDMRVVCNILTVGSAISSIGKYVDISEQYRNELRRIMSDAASLKTQLIKKIDEDFEKLKNNKT